MSKPDAGAGRSGVVRSRGWLLFALAANAAAIAVLWKAPSVWMDDILPRLRPHVTLWYLGVGGAIAAALLAWAWRSGPVRRGAACAAVGGVLAAYVALLFVYYKAGDAPAKKFHLLEYGLLAGATLQAVRVERDDLRGLVLALVFLAAVGTLDENLQRIIPMRTFRLGDMVANYIGIALGTAAWGAASGASPLRRA